MRTPAVSPSISACPLAAAALVGTLAAGCGDARAPTSAREPAAPPTSLSGMAGQEVTATGTIPLPINQSVSTSTPAFRIVQTGSGYDAAFVVSNSSNAYPALAARTTGRGRAGEFSISNPANFQTALFVQTYGTGNAGEFFIRSGGNPDPALHVATAGGGPALFATTTGTGPAGEFSIGNDDNGSAALRAQTTGSAEAGAFYGFNQNTVRPALLAHATGMRNALLVEQYGSCTSSTTSCNLAVFRTAGDVNRIRFARSGKGFFDGGTQNSGADVAEAFAVEGRVEAYEPGDVLVISTRSARRLEKSAEPYSARVAGVYAARPGVLLTERGIDESLADLVPLGVIGVIPTKVSAENGAIRPGDPLVTAATPGHAMRAEPVVLDGVRLYPGGAVLGKALETFAGPGTGLIRVLVSVR